MRRPQGRFAVLAVALIATATLLSGCTSGGSTESTSSSSGDAIKIGLLLPETKTARYEAFDRPLFEAKLTSLGNFEVIYANADQDPAKQLQQAESALTQGVKVLVLDPVDVKSAASIVASAKAQNVPVVSYDRLVASSDLAYYISYDNEQVGVLQGTALVDKMQADNTVSGLIMINGSPTDSNAADFKKGALSVIEPSGIPILASFDTPDWSPDKAQEWAAGQITQFGTEIQGVYAANDGTAGGAVAAYQASGVTPIPPVTGQDAELAGIQRIVAGTQYMTVFKAYKPEAEQAAQIAADLANGETVEGDTTVDGIPATILDPVVVTVDNIMDTVVADGLWTVEEICTPEYAEACTAAGIE